MVEEDELYSVWKKMKELAISNQKEMPSDTQCVESETESDKIFVVFVETLTLPQPVSWKISKHGGKSKVPSYISGDEAIKQMEDKMENRHIAEEKKLKNK